MQGVNEIPLFDLVLQDLDFCSLKSNFAYTLPRFLNRLIFGSLIKFYSYRITPNDVTIHTPILIYCIA